MARRTRSFLFDNISKRLVQNTNKTAKEINTRKTANTTANTDILTKAEVETVISNTSIATLSDTTVANVVNEQVLQYNANTAKWENETLSLVSSVDGLTDTNISSVQRDDYLKYDGTNWINSALDLSSYVTDTDIADYSNTAQMNTAIAASNTAMKSYVDSEVANVDFSAYSTTTQMNTAIASSNTAMKNYVDAEVAGIVNSAPAALDTLNELAAALGDDANFSTTTSTALGNRLRIDVSNQSLTSTQQTNALTNLGITATVTELNYVDGVTSDIQTQLDAKGTSSFSGAYADLTGKPSLFSGAYADLTGKPTIPTNNNQLTNGAGYITSSSLSSYATSTDLTDGTITKINSQATVGDSIEFFQNDGGGNLGIRFNANYNNAVEDGSAWEFEFANDSTSGDFRIYYDGSISTAGEAISWTEAFRLDGGDSSLYIFGDKVWDAGNLTNLNQLTNGPGYITGITSSMVTTALGYTPGTSSFSGSYNDLSNKPTIPTNNNQLTNGAGYITNSGGTTAATANTVAKRNGSADINARLFRSNYSNQSTISGAIAYRVNTSDNYIRFCSDAAAIRSFIGAGTSSFTANQSLDTSSNVTHNQIIANSWMRTTGEKGLYSQSYGQHFYPDSGGFYWDIDGPLRHRDGYEGGIKMYSGYHDSNGAGLLSSNGSWWVNQGSLVSDGSHVIIGGSTAGNAYNTTSSRRIMIGGGNNDASGNYYIGTNLENKGGNYNKLDLRWHTGIRMGAQGQYGGVRIFDSEDVGTVRLSINDTTSHSGAGVRAGPWAGSQSGRDSAFEIVNNGGTGDSNLANINFHCSGSYAVSLHLRADSYFGVGGWSASTWRWYVQTSTGNMTAAGNVTAYSDPRLKENITPLTGAVDKIKKLNGMEFTWKDLPNVVGTPGAKDYGVLSTEVAEVAPHAIHESPHTAPEGDTYKTVAYDKLIPLLIEAVKEQQKEIDELKARLS